MSQDNQSNKNDFASGKPQEEAKAQASPENIQEESIHISIQQEQNAP